VSDKWVQITGKGTKKGQGRGCHRHNLEKGAMDGKVLPTAWEGKEAKRVAENILTGDTDRGGKRGVPPEKVSGL